MITACNVIDILQNEGFTNKEIDVIDLDQVMWKIHNEFKEQIRDRVTEIAKEMLKEA